MELKNYNTYFFFFVLIGVSILTFLVFQPFLISILIAAILAIIFNRPYRIFLKLSANSPRISALATTLLALIVIIVPMSIIVGFVANELISLYQIFFASPQNHIDNILKFVNSIPNLQNLKVDEIINRESIMSSFSQIGQSLLYVAGSVSGGIANLFLVVFVVLFSLFFFLLDGKRVVERIMYISPLKDAHEKLLIEKFISMSRATIKGTLVMGIVQGVIGGAALYIAGVPSATVWAVAMMFMSLIPMIGSSVIWFPAGVILLLMGMIWQGAFVLAIGFFVISLVDNLLRPKLVGRDTQMHPLIVFFATVGGIMYFGFIGFIIGPIIAALFLSLWEIYGIEFKPQLKSFNK